MQYISPLSGKKSFLSNPITTHTRNKVQVKRISQHQFTRELKQHSRKKKQKIAQRIENKKQNDKQHTDNQFSYKPQITKKGQKSPSHLKQFYTYNQQWEEQKKQNISELQLKLIQNIDNSVSPAPSINKQTKMILGSSSQYANKDFYQRQVMCQEQKEQQLKFLSITTAPTFTPLLNQRSLQMRISTTPMQKKQSLYHSMCTFNPYNPVDVVIKPKYVQNYQAAQSQSYKNQKQCQKQTDKKDNSDLSKFIENDSSDTSSLQNQNQNRNKNWNKNWEQNQKYAIGKMNNGEVGQQTAMQITENAFFQRMSNDNIKRNEHLKDLEKYYLPDFTPQIISYSTQKVPAQKNGAKCKYVRSKSLNGQKAN